MSERSFHQALQQGMVVHPAIPLLRRWRQEDYLELEALLDYVVCIMS